MENGSVIAQSGLAVNIPSERIRRDLPRVSKIERVAF